MSAPLPPNEQRRLAALDAYRILDTLPESGYDDIARIAAYIYGTPVALVSLVDSDRQWFKARIGIEASETPRAHAFCAHAILGPDQVMVVPDAQADPRFSSNPLVTGEPHIRFYAGAPLVTPSGEAVGTLCVVDRQPRQPDPAQIEVLDALARQVVVQLELRRALFQLEQHAEHLDRHRRSLESANRELETLSLTDGLTGLANRRALERRLDDEMARLDRSGLPVSLILMDLDLFKQYNDAYGHPAGDDLLRTASKLIRSCCRSQDFAARYGGEEFAVVLPDTDASGARVAGERLRSTVERARVPHRPVTASVGIATATSEARCDASQLIARADSALYRAKAAGRNRVALAEGMGVT